MYIVQYDDESITPAMVGSKGYYLARLQGMGIRVPQGFILTGKAFLDFLEANGIGHILSDIPDDIEGMRRKSEDCLEAFAWARIPDEMSVQIMDACVQLAANSLAIRSSSIVEDLPAASMAGLYDSFLQVPLENVLERVKGCWQSAFGFRVLAYLKGFGFRYKSLNDMAMAVLIQEMIPPQLSGVMFTVNPISGDPSKIVIEYSPVLEGVVSGRVSPVSIIVDKITEKPSPLPSPTGRGGKIDEGYIQQLVTLGKMIEKYFGLYQDIEWVIDDRSSRVIILQARPETIWNKRKIKHEGLGFMSFLR
ncbi:PEP/pyruvate-binding domain-containing protein [Candidatus Desantisbacteria bacterium]|nr:PEP/pyruvate-binding domain-containing protein [Candidatus Desantisbacteria bacterium]